MSDDNSLGGEATLAGQAKRQQADVSLGDERTLGGDAAIQETPIDGLEVVDLAARYKIEGTLGQGGMGAVMLATDTRLDRKVAIKRILGEAARSKSAIARFLTEAKAIAALNHPNVVQIYDYGRAKDGPFLIMEFVDGGSLADRCKQGGIPLEIAVDLACQLCDGLAKAHDAGIIHRDIKPANVLLTKDGHPKLTDFGLAKSEAADHGMTMTGAVMGTPDFMPPEQRRDANEVDHRSDLWSLAATVYQMVTGRSPKIIRFNDIPAALQEVLAKALEDRKATRYQSAREFRDALKTTLRAAAVTVDDSLVHGKCPTCGVQNENSRKFCRGCGESLVAPCLKCSESMPLWDEICGSCGAKQTPLVDGRRRSMAASQAEAEGLLGDFHFDKASVIATTLRDEQHPRLRHLSSWADAFLDEVEKSRVEQTHQAVTAILEASKHEAAHDYPSAHFALENVPESMRGVVLPGATESADLMITRVKKKQAESVALSQRIKEAIGAQLLDGLLPDVERLLELQPERQDVQKIRQQLVERHQKQAAARDQAIARAKECLAVYDYEAALAATSSITAKFVTPESESLHTQAESLAQLVKDYSNAIKNAIASQRLDGLLSDVEGLLELQPNRQDIQKIRQQLIERDQKQAAARDQAIAQAKACLAEHDYEAALALTSSIPEAAVTSDSMELRRHSEYLVHRVREYSRAIKEAADAKRFEDLHRAVNEYLMLKPADKEILALRQSLVERDENVRLKWEHEGASRLKQAHQLERACRFDEATKVLEVIPSPHRSPDVQSCLSRCKQLAKSRGDAKSVLAGARAGHYAHAIKLGAPYQELLERHGITDAEFMKLLSTVQSAHASELWRQRVRELVGRTVGGVLVATMVAAVCIPIALWIRSSYRATALANAIKETRYDDALAIDPNNKFALAGRGQKRLTSTPPDYSGAIADFEHAKRLDSSWAHVNGWLANAHIEQAIAHARQGRLEDFERHYVESVQIEQLAPAAKVAVAEGWLAQAESSLAGKDPDNVRTAVEAARKFGASWPKLKPLLAGALVLEAAQLQSRGDTENALSKLAEATRTHAAGAMNVLERPGQAALRAARDEWYRARYATALAANDWDEVIRIAAVSESFAKTTPQWVGAAMSQVPHSVIAAMPSSSLAAMPHAAIAAMQPLQNSIGMQLKLIPPGTFIMGDLNEGRSSAYHRVTLTQPFYIGVYEVTNAQWRRVMGTVPSKWTADEQPVDGVPWDEAAKFCDKLSALPDERSAGRAYRLPTESEWEYTCRAGTVTKYPFGDYDERRLSEVAWFRVNSGNQTNPVGKLNPNPWGLYDTYGNVFEWCLDRYGAYPDGSVTDPQGPSLGDGRIFRGGNWNSEGHECRPGNRGRSSVLGDMAGLRIAMTTVRVPSTPDTEE